MLLTKEELSERIGVMGELGVSQMHQNYLIESANDNEFEDIIRLIDALSSKALAIAVASGDSMKIAIEKHLEARHKLIEKIKELDGRGND